MGGASEGRCDPFEKVDFINKRWGGEAAAEALTFDPFTLHCGTSAR